MKKLWWKFRIELLNQRILNLKTRVYEVNTITIKVKFELYSGGDEESLMDTLRQCAATKKFLTDKFYKYQQKRLNLLEKLTS
jgi:hypothetical protein